jgi:hypothetical protein|tara:strand:+ start:365 stop:595 length:231 start_codon:yes stop_codon:yes gene_type:complete
MSDMRQNLLWHARLMIAGVMGLLAGCANPMTPVESTDMIGPGRATDEYKLSPCTCENMELTPVDQQTIDALRMIYG